jgi:hypothetical protein
MTPRFVLALAALSTTLGQTAAAQTGDAPDRVVALQRLVFAIESTPQPVKVEAQLDLADVYAIGDGVEQDVELACGLAAIAGRISDRLDDEALLARARRMRQEICVQVSDPEAALQLASCPRFGVMPQTLPLVSGATLTVSRLGLRIESPDGTRESEWLAECGDVLASLHLVDVDPPGGTSWPRRQFLELLIWHQSQRDDGKIGDRSLVWKLIDVDRTEIRADEAIIVVKDAQASIWPAPPVPEEVKEGARLQMLRSGQIRWRFERAPELGTRLIAAPAPAVP